MENTQKHDTKYNNLANQYSKLRGQASVLKQAVLDEKNKSSQLQENLRIKETELRRAEQEIDSLGFRNKQLEFRVTSLKDDLEDIHKIKSGKNFKITNKSQKSQNIAGTHQSSTSTSSDGTLTTGTTGNIYNYDSVFTEELQKKILENAQLISLVDERNAEIQLNDCRIKELEELIKKQNNQYMDLERKLRKEIETLTYKNAELDTKLASLIGDGNGSIIGSDDTLSVTGSDHTPIHTIQTTNISSTSAMGPVGGGGGGSTSTTTTFDERIKSLEKEVLHWRTQYEILKMSDFKYLNGLNKLDKQSHKNNTNDSCNVPPNSGYSDENDINSDDGDSKNGTDCNRSSVINHEQLLIIERFHKKCEDIMMEKFTIESKSKSFEIECEKLKNHLKILHTELTTNEQKYKESQRNLQISEEDLALTRQNYEEKITLLSEQMIFLSNKLAELK